MLLKMKDNRVRENEETLLKGKDNKQILFKETNTTIEIACNLFYFQLTSKQKVGREFNGREARGKKPIIEIRLRLAVSTVRI